MDSSVSRYGHVLEHFADQLNHLREMSAGPGTGVCARCSQDGVTRGAGDENFDEPYRVGRHFLRKNARRWKQHAGLRPAAIGPSQALVRDPLQDLLQMTSIAGDQVLLEGLVGGHRRPRPLLYCCVTRGTAAAS